MLLHEIIERLESCDCGVEGYSFSVREVNFESWDIKDRTGDIVATGRKYLIRLLFKGESLKTLEGYYDDVIASFSVKCSPMEFAENIKGNFIFPTHEGGEYRISCTLSISE